MSPTREIADLTAIGLCSSQHGIEPTLVRVVCSSAGRAKLVILANQSPLVFASYVM